MGKPEHLALGVVAGALSAALFASALADSGGLAAVFPVHFTSLPILFASVSLGAAPFAAACATGVLGVAVGSGAGFYGGLIYMGIHLVPVSLIYVRLHFAKQNLDTPGFIGRLVCELTVLAAVALLIILAGAGFDVSRLTEDVAVAFGKLLGAAAPDVPSDARETFVAELVRYFPGFVAVWWLLSLVVCAVLAQAAARRFGMASFPTPQYRAFEVPVWLVGLFLVTLLPAALLRGNVASVAGSFALLFGTPLLLQGLAVIHTVSRSWPGRRLLLFACYGSLIWPFAPLAWALVTALGVIEHFGRFRRPHLV